MKYVWICVFSFFSLFAADDIRVMGSGFCTMDLLVQVEDAFIEEHIVPGRGGNQEGTFELIDSVLAKVKRVPKVVPGGSAANTVRALARLGQPCAFLGHVGRDHWGEHFASHLEKHGVELRLKHAPFTSRVLCLISPDGQRSFLACDPRLDTIPDKSDFKDVKWIHLEARNLFNRAVFEKTVELARESAIPLSMDLSCCRTVKHFKEDLLRIIENDVDLLFCNEDEAALLLGLDPKAACYELQKRCTVAVVTLGKEGALIGHKDKVVSVPAYPTQVVDTTGAGDYFSAGFIYGYLRSLPLEECACIGHRLAKAVVAVIGTELAEESWEALRRQIIP